MVRHCDHKARIEGSNPATGTTGERNKLESIMVNVSNKLECLSMAIWSNVCKTGAHSGVTLQARRQAGKACKGQTLEHIKNICKLRT